MTSLRDEVAALSRPVRMECSVKTFLRERPSDEPWADLFAEARVRGSELTAHGLWLSMKERGYRRTDQPVERHVRGECTCDAA